MKITTEIKARRFCDLEKTFLFSYLVREKRDKCQEFYKLLNEYIINLVKKVIITDDYKFLVSRPYCCVTNKVKVDPEPLGLPVYYKEETKGGVYSRLLKVFDLDDIFLPCPYGKYYYSNNIVDITEKLIENCSEEEIDQLKIHLINSAKLYYEVNNFGIGTWIKSNYDKFPDIYTWGQLLSKSPEYFEILYNNYIGSDISLNEEEELLEKMKKALGY